MNKELWEKSVAFHGHECPGLAVGFKACEAATKKLGIQFTSDEEMRQPQHLKRWTNM